MILCHSQESSNTPNSMMTTDNKFIDDCKMPAKMSVEKEIDVDNDSE